jgi:hypothetical protein
MNESKKSIVIDSASLIGGGGGSGGGVKRKSRRSGERKIRPSSIVQPSTLKKTLLERIKQHQRTRERARNDDTLASNKDETSVRSGPTVGTEHNENFTQSMNFLRELAIKRRTLKNKSNQNPPNTHPQTPEAQQLNQVGNTLRDGVIHTNTGLLGLPVVPMLSSQIASSKPVSPSPVNASVESMGLAPMAVLTQEVASPTTVVENIIKPPKITDLAEMYNNTIATTAPTNIVAGDSTSSNVSATTSEPPLHIPAKPEDFLPSIFIKEDPPHGCLKGGRKPTFREWVGKMLGGENNSTPEPKEPVENGEETTPQIPEESITGMRVKIRKTKKKSYRLGKHDNVVGVLLKNKQTQRHIQSQHLSLRQKTIGEIRKYLYDHHLLKIGSNAPPDVLRRMYEDAILTGDVKNTNDNVLIHNFMSGGGGE